MSLKITNVRLPFDTVGLNEEEGLYAVVCEDGKVRSVAKMRVEDSTVDKVEEEKGEEGGVEDSEGHATGRGAMAREVLDGEGGLLLPSLCHSHIHLDKCYILDKGEPLVTGDFAEALRLTARTKAGFPADTADLYARGERLVRASVEAGVTCIRAHVEVDRTVGDACLRTALRLKEKWRGVCDVLICVFMQDPLFDAADDDEPGENARHLVDALSAFCPSPPSSSSSVRPYIDPNAQLISAIGSAPYVERTRAQQLANIGYIVALAQRYSLHVDFHLDYDLRPLEGEGADDRPLIWAVLEQLDNAARARTLDERTVVAIGHATRLTRFPTAKLLELRARIEALPYAVHFIGLPQSDMYMMGRRPVSVAQAHTNASEDDAYDAPRGTLNAVRLRTALGFGSVALAVNNVGNAFTPQGAPDPLALCPLGVAVYQDGTSSACAALLEAITIASKHAIGINSDSQSGFRPRPSPSSDHSTQLPENQTQSQSRPWHADSLRPTPGTAADFVLLHENGTVQDAALCPSYERTTVKAGRVVAWRRTQRWVGVGS